MAVNLDAMETLAAAIAVLFVGAAVQARVGILRDNNIPIPVVGGLLFAVLTTVAFLGWPPLVVRKKKGFLRAQPVAARIHSTRLRMTP